MTLLLPLLMAFGILSCLPAWFASRRRGQAGRWSLFAVLPGLLVWALLAAAGIGPQSLVNLVMELFDLVLGSIVLYYLKVFVLDRYTRSPDRNTAYVIVIASLAALLLRLFMPALPG